MKAIAIMQNRDLATDSVVCTINFKSADINIEETEIRVDLPAKFAALDSSLDVSANSTFTFWLSSTDGNFVISNVKADDFYSTYRSVVHDLENLKNRERDLASRKIFFDQARVLQQTYDTVIWCTKYQDSIYYYVVNGSWKNYFIGEDTTRALEVKMGLVSETGRVVVPPAFDLVGTIGFETDNVIEVKKDGRVGHYSLAGEEIAPAAYDWIIPYENDGAYALVKADSTYGWLDGSHVYHAGFPSAEAEKFIFEFGYLDKKLTIDASMATAEILHTEHMGWGIVIPASHLVKAGVLREVIVDIYLGENALGWGGTESIKTEGSFFEQISDQFSALMVNLRDNYLEGREGFYARTNVTFLNDRREPLGTYTFTSGTLTFNKVDSTLMEVRVTSDYNLDESSVSEADDDEWNAPYYQYFSMTDGKLMKLQSNRSYEFTQFVKIDSSYLTGKFVRWDEEANDVKASSFAPEARLKYMRNEILADYGYIFVDEKTSDSFFYRESYRPRFKRYEDFYDSMTDVDRHNLEFLEKIVGTLRSNTPS
jgi:hypothetical protein